MEAAQILSDGELFSFYKPYKYVYLPRMMGIHRIASQGMDSCADAEIGMDSCADAEIAVVMMQEGRAEIFPIGKEIGRDEWDCSNPTLPLQELEDMEM